MLVLVGGFEIIKGHLLVEDGCNGAGERRHDPHPVGGATTSLVLLVSHELNERLGSGVVVDEGYSGHLWRV